MIDDIRRAEAAAIDAAATASSLDALRQIEIDALGKKGVLAGFKSRLGSVPSVDERKHIGQVLNEATASVAAAAAARRETLASEVRTTQLAAERLDLTEATGGPTRGHLHLVTQAWRQLEDVFIGLGFQIAEGPEVETDYYNFEALNMPPSHPARSMWDTLFVEHGEPGTTVLRTHTSPVQIRVMEEWPPPIYAVMPGRVFRRDTPDATHMPVFHQIEGLVIDRHITLGDLAGTIESFTKAFFGAEFTSRLRPSYFPFTEPS